MQPEPFTLPSRSGPIDAWLYARFGYYLAGELLHFGVTNYAADPRYAVTHLDSGLYVCHINAGPNETLQATGFHATRCAFDGRNEFTYRRILRLRSRTLYAYDK